MIKRFLKKIYYKIIPSTEVIITPKGARWGNLLYFFLRAYLFEKKGKKLKILYTEHMEDLMIYFPNLKKYIILEEEVNFFHKKDTTNNFYQKFNYDFTENNLNDFIKNELLISNAIISLLSSLPTQNDDEITINIRRGDFYEKENFSIYGYNQIGFLKHVFEKHLNFQYWKKINVISDDMCWCKENLNFLNTYTSELFFPNLQKDKIITSFLWIANSKKIILSNSTFSFWGAYISNTIFNNHKKIYAPIFGIRLNNQNIDLYQLNQSWNIIKDFDF